MEMTVGLKRRSEWQLLSKRIGLLIMLKQQIQTNRKSIPSITDTFIYLYHNIIFYIALCMLKQLSS